MTAGRWLLALVVPLYYAAAVGLTAWSVPGATSGR